MLLINSLCNNLSLTITKISINNHENNNNITKKTISLINNILIYSFNKFAFVTIYL